jgi:hypothetical protein
MGNFWNKPAEPIQTSLEEDNWTIGLRVVLLENIQPLEASGNTTGTVTKVKQMIEDNTQTYKEIKQAVLNGDEIDEDWATKSNWICIDHLCPNPYTHARGDPCKLTMEDLFPYRPEPSTSEDVRQPEDDSEDWLIEWDKKNN